MLKWMLVTCFGYTDIESQVRPDPVHERITAISRELLMDIKELAEDMDFEVLHGIVDCLWVRGGPDSIYTEAVSRYRHSHRGGRFDWIAFLPWPTARGRIPATSAGWIRAE